MGLNLACLAVLVAYGSNAVGEKGASLMSSVRRGSSSLARSSAPWHRCSVPRHEHRSASRARSKRAVRNEVPKSTRVASHLQANRQRERRSYPSTRRSRRDHPACDPLWLDAPPSVGNARKLRRQARRMRYDDERFGPPGLRFEIHHRELGTLAIAACHIIAYTVNRLLQPFNTRLAILSHCLSRKTARFCRSMLRLLCMIRALAACTNGQSHDSTDSSRESFRHRCSSPGTPQGWGGVSPWAALSAFSGEKREIRHSHTSVPSLEMVVDSGCVWHVVKDASILINTRPCADTMYGADGIECECTLMGDLPVMALDSDGTLRKTVVRNVRCVPSFVCPMISVRQLWDDSKVDVFFRDVRCICVPSPTGDVRLPFRLASDLLFRWNVQTPGTPFHRVSPGNARRERVGCRRDTLRLGKLTHRDPQCCRCWSGPPHAPTSLNDNHSTAT